MNYWLLYLVWTGRGKAAGHQLDLEQLGLFRQQMLVP